MPQKPERKSVEEVAKEIKDTIPGVRIFKGSDPEAQLKIQPFGVKEIDELCRGTLCGGYTLLWGPEKGGKSTLMARAMGQMQRDGRRVLLVDLEGRLETTWMERQGVNLKDLYIQRGGKDLEANLNAVNAMVREGAVDAVAIDSISARAPRGEVEDKQGNLKGIEEDTMALLARKLSQWFRIFTALATGQNIPVIILSQTRTANLQMGAYQDMTGGRAPKHWGSTILKITRAEKIEATRKGEKVELGYWARIELTKTSLCANEGREILLPFYFGIGFDDVGAAVRAAIKEGLIEVGAKSQVTFQDKSYRSETTLVEEARNDPALAQAITLAVAKKQPEAGVQALTPEDQKAPAPLPPEPTEPPAGDEEFICKISGCGQVAKSLTGLKIHQGKTHKK